MSLYAYGKLKTPATAAAVAADLQSVGSHFNVVVKTDELDVDDVETLESFGQLRGHGLCFAIGTTADPTEATELWNEAMVAMRAALGGDAVIRGILLGERSPPSEAVVRFRETRLGRCCLALMDLGSMGGGIALVDGAIESTFLGRPDDCLMQMSIDVVRPWDQSPNRIYVW